MSTRGEEQISGRCLRHFPPAARSAAKGRCRGEGPAGTGERVQAQRTACDLRAFDNRESVTAWITSLVKEASWEADPGGVGQDSSSAP